MKKFEKVFSNCYRFVPMFESGQKKNSPQLRFRYLKAIDPSSSFHQNQSAKKHVQNNFPLDLNDAYKSKSDTKKGELSTERFVLDMEDNKAKCCSLQRPVSVIDLTTDIVQPKEPEVIVLDETTDQFDQSVLWIEDRFGEQHKEQNMLPRRSTRRRCTEQCNSTESSDVQVIKVLNKSKSGTLSSPSIISPSSDFVIFTSPPEPNSPWSKKKPLSNLNSTFNRVSSQYLHTSELKGKGGNKNKRKRSCSQTVHSPAQSKVSDEKSKKKRKRSCSQTLHSPAQSKVSDKKSRPRKKKKKILDLNKIYQPENTRSSPRLKHLSVGVNKYYENIGKVNDKFKAKNDVKLTRSQLLKNNTKAQKSNQPLLNINIRKSPLKSSFKHRRSFKSLQRQNRKNNKAKLKTAQIVNTHNPNPVVVELEGKRPIAIDANNVAKGHGRGQFSARGLEICVDYFVQRGYTNKEVKVFMPSIDQHYFSNNMLEELKLKCDIVLTPSRNIEGQLVVPYDDRFIVGYAVEFGAVIVSNDNYRDLILEKPEWKNTILQRLLMFSWVDDFLMFPSDPLGKKGPTLNEFFHF